MNWRTFYTILCLFATPCLVHAEWELGAYGGVAFPNPTHVHQALPGQATDLLWQHAYAHTSGTWGVLATHWQAFHAVQFGVQGEVQRFDFNLKNQHNTRRSVKHGASSMTDEDLNPHDTDVTLLAINVLLRKDFGWAKPYFGGGGGLALADTRSWDYYNEAVTPSDQSDLSPAPFWQVLGGIQVPLGGSRWSLFSQYKFTHSAHQFDFGGAMTSWTIEAHHLLGGINYQF